MASREDAEGGSPSKEEFLTGLARGLSVLKAFSAHHPEMTISQVAVVTGLSPAVARRCLLTLVHLGYVLQRGNLFMLNVTVLEFGAAFFESTGLSDAVQPLLEDLRTATGDSASFNVLDGDDILQVLYLPTLRLIREVFITGARLPAYLTPTGRVFLAQLSDDELDDYLNRITITPRTDRTVKTPEDLRVIVEKVRVDGFAVVVDEIEYGLSGIAVPIFHRGARAVAALGCGIIVGAERDVDTLVESRLPVLRSTASEIGNRLRASPALVRSLPHV